MVEAVAVLFCYEEIFWIIVVLAAVTRGRRRCQVLLFCCFAVDAFVEEYAVALHVYIARIPAIAFLST